MFASSICCNCSRTVLTKHVDGPAREFTNHSSFVCFVDLKKAYDSVNREALWSAVELCYGLPNKILNSLKAFHKDTMQWKCESIWQSLQRVLDWKWY